LFCHEKQTTHPKWKVRQRITAAGRFAKLIRTLKGYYVRNDFNSFTHSHVARHTAHLATQPELGLLPERRIGLGSGYSGSPDFGGPHLKIRTFSWVQYQAEIQGSRINILIGVKQYRMNFELPVVTVGGSNGKIPTNELLAAVVRKRDNTLWSETSFSNDLRVPLT
jgi:hypothetical protein